MTPFLLAQRFIGEITELGADDHPLIQWFHMLCFLGPNQPDETPWCSSFVNGVCWLLRFPRSKSASARSWLGVGVPITLDDAIASCDIVVLERGPAPQGHVGFYAGHDAKQVFILGGNQNNGVSVLPFPVKRILGIRRLQA